MKKDKTPSTQKGTAYNVIVSLFFVYTVLWLLRVLGLYSMQPSIQFVIEAGMAIALFLHGRSQMSFFQDALFASRVLYIFGIYNIVMFILSIVFIEYTPNIPIVISNLPGFFLIYSTFAFGDAKLLNAFVKIAKYGWVPIFICVIGYYLVKGTPYGSLKSNYFFLLVFIVYPFIKKRVRYIFDIGILAYSYIYVESRSMILISMVYFFFYILVYHTSISNRLLRFIPKIMLLTTILLFFLAASGIFNVLTDFSKSTATTDSRSGLFLEINEHLAKHKAYVFGTPGKGYISSFNDLREGKNADGDYVDFRLWWHGRMSVEAGILTLALQGGLVNVLLLTTLFFATIYYVCKHARNRYCLYIAILLAFRYSFMFVDGLLSFFNQSIVMWMMFAMCMSKYYLNKTDEEVNKMFKSMIMFKSNLGL